MSTVHISNEYTVSIPSDIIKAAGLKKGQKMSVIAIADTIELIPEKNISDLFGSMPNLTLDDIRDEDDRY